MTASDPCLNWRFDSPAEITAAGLEDLQRQRAQLAADEAEHILRLAELCPADDDPAPDHPGAKKRSWSPHEERPGVSEFFLDELAMVLNAGRGTAAFRARRAFLTTRDRTCRHPHCGQRVGWADHDHVIPHARDGATDCANLCCLCRSHHRLKTFARGWSFQMRPDGTLTVTTPSGITRVTRPPGVRRPPPEPMPC